MSSAKGERATTSCQPVVQPISLSTRIDITSRALASVQASDGSDIWQIRMIATKPDITRTSSRARGPTASLERQLYRLVGGGSRRGLPLELQGALVERGGHDDQPAGPCG